MRRVERHRGFESYRFRQFGVLAELVEGTFLLRKHTPKGYHWFESNTLRHLTMFFSCYILSIMSKKLKNQSQKVSKPRNYVAKDLFTPKYSMKVEHSIVNFYSRAAEKQNFRKNYVTFL